MNTDMPLYHLAFAPVPDDMAKGCVASFVTPEGSWHWNIISHPLPPHVLLMIAAIKPPDINGGNNQYYWAHSNSVFFTAKLAYQQLSSVNFTEEDSC